MQLLVVEAPEVIVCSSPQVAALELLQTTQY